MPLHYKYPKTCTALIFGLVFAAYCKPSLPTELPLPLNYVEPPQSTHVDVDDKQLNCLAANIYYEGRNQPALGQLAIGLTTVTRARQEGWPTSICGVVKQRGQFSWVGKKHKQPKWDQLAYLRSVSLANQILSGDFDNLIPLFAPTYFHTTRVNPKWNRHLEKLVVIKDHVFYE